MKNKNSNPLKILEDYLTIKKYAKRSIVNYTSAVKKVKDFSNKDIYHLTVDDFNSYIHHAVTELDLSISHINQVISGGKLFLKIGLGKRNYTINKLERPRKRKKLPIVLAVNEVKNMIKSAENIKHKAIILTLYELGIRRQELIDLKWSDIDRKQGVVRINNSKGAKDRVVQLTQDLIDCLEKYYRRYKSKNYIFEGQYGGKYSATSIDKVVKNHSKLTKKRVSPHIIRHSVFTHLMDNGTDIEHIRNMAGHESDKTTRIYLHTSTKTFKNLKRSSVYES